MSKLHYASPTTAPGPGAQRGGGATWGAHLTVAAHRGAAAPKSVRKPHEVGPLPGRVKWGAAAVAAELTFMVMLAAADLLPGQSPRHTTLSALVQGPVGWSVISAFVVHAVSLGALAMHLRSRAPTAAVACLVAAAGMLGVAAFETGAGWPGTAHDVGAWLSFGGVAVAGGATAWAGTRRGPVARRHVRWLGAAVVVGTVVMAASLLLGGFPVFERLQVALNGAWIIATAWPRAFS